MADTRLLPPFPTDDEALDLLSAALDSPQVSVFGVLDLLSGVTDLESEGPIYGWWDVIEALITEVRRLRGVI